MQQIMRPEQSIFSKLFCCCYRLRRRRARMRMAQLDDICDRPLSSLQVNSQSRDFVLPQRTPDNHSRANADASIQPAVNLMPGVMSVSTSYSADTCSRKIRLTEMDASHINASILLEIEAIEVPHLINKLSPQQMQQLIRDEPDPNRQREVAKILAPFMTITNIPGLKSVSSANVSTSCSVVT